MVDSRILCRMRAVRIVSEGKPINARRREEAAACRGESNRLPASGFWLSPACCFWIHKQNPITVIGRLRPLPPFGAFRHHLSPATRSGDKRKAPLNFSFPLEGKCHEVAKGCTRVRMIMILRCCSMHRLTSPDLHILCRMCTVGLWILCNVPHVSPGKHRANLPLRGRRRRQATEGVHFHHPSGRLACFPRQSPVVWFSLRCCHKLRLIPSPSTHSAPIRGKGGGVSHQRGAAVRQR